MRFWIFTFVLMLLFACKDEPTKVRQDVNSEKMQIFQKVSNESSGLNFTNRIQEDRKLNSFLYDGLLQGSGIGIIDINNDGLQDVFFTSSQGNDRLFLNKGKLKFEDITKKAGIKGGVYYSAGVSIVDINNDGFDDIYIARFLYQDEKLRKNVLYVNQKDGTFIDQAEQYGIADIGFSTCATFFDLDNDNDLDLYVGNQPPNDIYTKEKLKGVIDFKYTDRLYRNENGKFVEVTKSAGVEGYNYTLSVNPIDYNNDGFKDLLISVDFDEPDRLYLNNQDGTFTNMADTVFRHMSNFSMGTDIADIDNDGFLDMYTVDMVAEDNYRQKTNMSGMNPEKFWSLTKAGYHFQYMFNVMHLNNGNGTFSDIAQMAGISNTDWSWTPLFMDLDLDGYQDLIVTNGVFKEVRNKDYEIWLKDYFKKAKEKADKTGKPLQYDPLRIADKAPSIKLKNFIYKNNGDLTFKKMSDAWGFGDLSWSSGAAYADLDNDGDLDVIMNNTNMPSFLYKNTANDNRINNYIQIKLKGPKGNAKGIGATVKIQYDGKQQIGQMNPYRGYFSTSEALLQFGLGKYETIGTITVNWPDGKQTVLTDVAVNKTLEIDYSKATGQRTFPNEAGYFTSLAQKEAIVHKENEFDDYKREILLPHKMSTLGPIVAVADINKDGNDDFYLGGSKGEVGMLYLGSASGQFTATKQAAFVQDRNSEDGAAIFFDADGDGDLDLYVASGGNEMDANHVSYQDRLYINTNGTFKRGRLPKLVGSNHSVAAGDFDGDGDMDLFVGGRQVPGHYGFVPKSYFLTNNKGTFKIQEEKDLGMVTTAEYADIDGDDKKELVLAGDWIPLQAWSYTGKEWKKKEISGFEKTNGWWNKVVLHDMDQDGDLDILAGNLGLNLKFKASKDQPFKVYVDDFDENGTHDVYLGYYSTDGKCYPVRGRQCSSEQMPFVKKKFGSYTDFGSATITDVLDDKMKETTQKGEVYNFKSAYFENDGSGNFTMKPFDNYAQISPLFGFGVMDVDKDGKLDIVAAGNYYNREVETTRSDAGRGAVMVQKDGGFHTLPVTKSGIYAYRDVREVKALKVGNKTIIAIFNNNDPVEFYQLK